MNQMIRDHFKQNWHWKDPWSVFFLCFSLFRWKHMFFQGGEKSIALSTAWSLEILELPGDWKGKFSRYLPCCHMQPMYGIMCIYIYLYLYTWVSIYTHICVCNLYFHMAIEDAQLLRILSPLFPFEGAKLAGERGIHWQDMPRPGSIDHR